ncbi:alpha/beta fold hydrolase [Aquisediminimonas profunda]|uniref:alpha/beta fold hydrolase n=1 Tax=Aquisediminimonas profunda TaxID=1550733 RepID=UPI001C6269C9|nr:alpha/beta hydrolase [Aquisediminimonas profunda]
MAAQTQHEDGFWWSKDGLRLHYRDYAGRTDRPPILCIPGLTRNARDFAHVAERLSGEWRLICVDLRGRGESGYSKLPMSYGPLTYLQDIEDLLETLQIGRFVCFGTSLGGLMTMMLAAHRTGRIAGALLNDIGPVIEEAGLERIRGYVGKSASWPSWMHAARATENILATAHPDYEITQWISLSKRLNRLTAQGRIVPDYDMRIAEPMRHPAVAVDLWPALDALRDVPVHILRGELSDILSADTAAAMVKRLPHARLSIISRTGHPPELDERESIEAIDALLAEVARQA